MAKLGTGTLELSAGGTYVGVGAQGFPLIARQGILLLSGGTNTVTGEAVVGGNFGTSPGAAGFDARLQVDNGALNISGYLSVGRGNGVGGVSSDLVVNNAATVSAANFSGGFNGGNALNLPKGTVTLNNTSSLTITGNGVLNVAESAGSNIALTLNDSSTLAAAGTGFKAIGNGGTGALTINNAATATLGGVVTVGYSAGTGTLNMTGGTLSIPTELRVGGNDTGNVATSNGTGTFTQSGGIANVGGLTLARGNGNLNSNSGTASVSAGTLTATGDVILGYAGSGTGTLNVSGTGTVNVGTTTTRTLNISFFDTSKGQINVSGGNLNLNTNSLIKFTVGNTGTNSTNAINQTGGNVTYYSDNATAIGGTGVLDLQTSGAATVSNTYNLNGGTLTVPRVISTLKTGTRVFNFNGGTLTAATSSTAANFMVASTASAANVRNGGARIDTNGLTVTVGQVLQHSAVGGDNNIDGGLTKLNAGTLELTAANTFTGATNITAGTLLLSTGSINASNVANVTGTGALTLGNAMALSDTLTLSLVDGTALNLNAASGSETIGSLILNGNGVNPGTYMASDLMNMAPGITFTSMGETLTVTTAVPEPSTWAVGLLGLGALGWRERRRVRSWLRRARVA